MAKRKILIIGAGLAGLSTAWHLKKKGIDCRIFEKDSEIGGLCRSKKINGFTFDCDGHLLHFKHKYTFNLIKELLGEKLAKHERSSWVYSHGRYNRYPFQANLYGLPSSVVKDCLLGFINKYKNGHSQKDKAATFYDWINLRFGEGIARHFMLSYNAKFWNMHPRHLTCEWLDGLIPTPSLSQLIDGTIKENKELFGYNAQFWYPKEGGIDLIARTLANGLNNIHVNHGVKKINVSRREIETDTGEKVSYDFLVSTAPVPELPRLADRLPGQIENHINKLKWNSIFNVNLGINGNGLPKYHWAYFPQKDVCFFRVGFYHNFSSKIAPVDKSSLYVEVSYSQDKPVNRENIIEKIKKDLKKVGLLKNGCNICCKDENDIKYGYPIYDVNYSKAQQGISEFLIKNNIIPCGRYGSWRYMSMSDVIMDGKETAEAVLKK